MKVNRFGNSSVAITLMVFGIAATTLAALPQEVGPAAPSELDEQIRQAAQTIWRDPELARYATSVLYSTMVEQHMPRNALDVFERAKAGALVRQALLTDNWALVTLAAVYFEKTPDSSALPQLVCALERNNYRSFYGISGGNTVHAPLQQALVRAIRSVTGLNEAAKAILPDRRFEHIDHEAIAGFVAKAREWAKQHRIDLYAPAEVSSRKEPLTLESQTDSLIHMMQTAAGEDVKQAARDRLTRLRHRIDVGLKEEAAVPEKEVPGRGQP